MRKLGELLGGLIGLVALMALAAIVFGWRWLFPLETPDERWHAEKNGPFG